LLKTGLSLLLKTGVLIQGKAWRTLDLNDSADNRSTCPEKQTVKLPTLVSIVPKTKVRIVAANESGPI
jgi:hypothetical protein